MHHSYSTSIIADIAEKQRQKSNETIFIKVIYTIFILIKFIAMYTDVQLRHQSNTSALFCIF